MSTDSYRLTLQKDLTYAVEITAPNAVHKIVRGFLTLREAEAWLSHQRTMAAIAARSGATHEGGTMIAARAPRRYR